MKLNILLSPVTALIAMVVLLSGLVCGCGGKSNSAAEQAASAAAQKWLTEIDNGQYGQSWQDAASSFQGAITKQKWVSALTGVRKPLGDLESRKLAAARYTTQLPGAPDGQYVVMQFDTSFADKNSAVETVTFELEKDGQWKASGYFIK
ncbi:MAG: DUF4019 domain-containing protein [Limisphaerales bacterium]